MRTESVIRRIARDADLMMQKYGISFVTGFLAENPSLDLASGVNNSDLSCYLGKVHEIASKLPSLTKTEQVAIVVNSMPISPWSFQELPWRIQNHLMLDLAMIEHAYFREILGYRTVQNLFTDTSTKYLPVQLAVPLWRLHKITGMSPTMSYVLYGLWNWRKLDPNGPITIDNIDVIHSFTGGPDESWFVRIHHVVQATESPAIRYKLRAYLASKYGDSALLPYTTKCLKLAAIPLMRKVAVLKRMSEYCEPGTYFDKVRMFYAFPRNVVFEGVEELGGHIQNYEGETGGGSPDQQLHDNINQISHRESSKKYRDARRKQMPTLWQELLELTQDSQLRDFVVAHKYNEEAMLAFNSNVYADIDWRLEHNHLVSTHIRTFGEERGTANPVLEFLWDTIEDTRNALIY